MNKILLIIQREYLTRVRKKSFIVMTILGPILMASMFVIPVWVATMKDGDSKKIAVIDQTHTMQKVLKNTDEVQYTFIDGKSLDEVKESYKKEDYYAVLEIPQNPDKEKLTIYSYKQPSLDVKNDIVKKLEDEIEQQRLQQRGINQQTLDSMKVNLSVDIYKWNEKGDAEKSSTELLMVVGFIAGFLIYIFVFVFGSQVMRGVIEEKTSRVVEIIISSVRPFELMMGKIVGIALVALTQFIIWIVLTAGIVSFSQSLLLGKNIDKQQLTQNMVNAEQMKAFEQNENVGEIFQIINNIDFGLLIGCFLFYFIGGYLIYASLFAAIGGAVDNETDTQQFMLPITLPLILSIILVQAIVQNPDGQIAFWLSMIPFTSPVIMMVRVAFGVPDSVPYWQLILSMTILVLTFIGTTWLSAKIYRTGILMYGKKVTYKELWKWLRYRS